MDFKFKTITCLAIIFIGYSLTAQNNLVFNRVLTFSLGLGETCEVPEGRTWKIENFSSSGANQYSEINLSRASVDYGSTDNFNYPNRKGFDMNATSKNNVWLQEGTAIWGPNTSSLYHKFSILEFIIEPNSSSSGTDTGGSGVSSDGLVFNRLVNTTFSGSFFGGNRAAALRTTGSITIPPGKIWKVYKVDSYYLSSLGGDELLDRANESLGILIGDNLIKESTDFTFLSGGTYVVKIKTDGNPINKVVVQAIEYNE